MLMVALLPQLIPSITPSTSTGFPSSCPPSNSRNTPGGIVQVKSNENSLEVDSLARFAVEEHNKKQNAMLDFVKVLNTKLQVVAGTTYYITLEATDGGVKQAYEAKVWVKPWQNVKEVQEFKLVSNDLAEGSA